MSIFYKDTDSQDFSEIGINSNQISVEKLTELIRKRENLGEMEEVTLINPGTREKYDRDYLIRSGTRVVYQLDDALDGFDDEDILEHVMTSNKPAQETQKPVNTRPNYNRGYMPPKYPPKMDVSKPVQPPKPVVERKTSTEDFSGDLKCPICKNLMRDAVQVLCCNEAYCEDCIKKKSKCPSCGNEVNENNIIPNKFLREKIEKHGESNIEPNSPVNPPSSKIMETIEKPYDEPKAPPPLEKRESYASQEPDLSNNEEDNYSRPSYPDVRPPYQPPNGAPGYYPQMPAPPMSHKPPPPMGGRPGQGAYGGGMYPPGPDFRGPNPMYPSYGGMGGYPNPSMYGGYPPMYGGYPGQMPPYMYGGMPGMPGMPGMSGMPGMQGRNPYEMMRDPNNAEMMEYGGEEEQEEEEKSEKSKKSKKHKHKSERRHSSPDRSRSRSRSKSTTRNNKKNKSRSPSKKKHKKSKKHRK